MCFLRLLSSLSRFFFTFIPSSILVLHDLVLEPTWLFIEFLPTQIFLASINCRCFFLLNLFWRPSIVEVCLKSRQQHPKWQHSVKFWPRHIFDQNNQRSLLCSNKTRNGKEKERRTALLPPLSHRHFVPVFSISTLVQDKFTHRRGHFPTVYVQTQR